MVVPDINNIYESINILLRPILDMCLPQTIMANDCIRVSKDIMIPISDSDIPLSLAYLGKIVTIP